MSDDCIFCKIVQGRIPCYKLFENDAALAFLDIGPLSEGHTLVIPKAHHERLEDLPAELAGELVRLVQWLAPAVTAAVGAPGYNLLNNNHPCAGQLVKHVHLHLIPRRPDDAVFTQWPARTYPTGRAQQLAHAITSALAPRS